MVLSPWRVSGRGWRPCWSRLSITGEWARLTAMLVQIITHRWLGEADGHVGPDYHSPVSGRGWRACWSRLSLTGEWARLAGMLVQIITHRWVGYRLMDLLVQIITHRWLARLAGLLVQIITHRWVSEADGHVGRDYHSPVSERGWRTCWSRLSLTGEWARLTGMLV